MPRTKEQYEEMRRATREKIQAAAMHVFARKGFGAANVQDIAETAGISIGLMYRHYKTKEVLFRELVEFAAAGMGRAAERFESGDSPRLVISNFAGEVWRDMTSGDELANLLILMSRYAAEPAGETELIVGQNERMMNAAAGLIQRGQQLGEFRAGDPDAMTLLFFAALQGLAEMKLNMGSRFVMPSAELLTAFLFKEG
ncbi:TetR/AcrR family transcriptional regulator [Paenibacillus pasadenensis]|uniref:TetR/AcrR family transcriptional regulator n=1 Tax=Paenibacillus pasadenensis TaxID=217090 RepID=UPI00203A8BB8|nr:TetR/AcrR family transcriptional regulator [Paenibacillus pasadenensis]MCM3746997.1 TetR/AcrR family transcriptional regulator [Paenibacillus pasadenensis]